MSSNLMVVQSDPRDAGSQRCRLGPELMMKLGLNIVDHVKLSLGHSELLCKAWPRQDLAEGILQADQFVYREVDKRYVAEKFINENCVEKVEVGKLLRADIAVVVAGGLNNAVVKDKSLLEAYIGQKLLNVAVFRNCTVSYANKSSLDNIAYVLVRDVECADSEQCAGYITKKTEFNVLEVIRLEQYNQRQQSSGISLGALQRQATVLKEAISLPLMYPQTFHKLCINRPMGVLLLGPPGVGKTSLVRTVAAECHAHLVALNGPDVFGPHPGESEENLRRIFQEAVTISEEGPCVLFIDELDALCPKRGGSGKSQENRMVAQMLTLMDGHAGRGRLVVIAATNRPNAIDPALRRPGRFDKEVHVGVPNQQERREILQVVSRGMSLAEDVDLSRLAEMTPGYTGADLTAVCHLAAYSLLSRGQAEDKNPTQISMEALRKALTEIRPSALRGFDGTTEVSPVGWSAIGGLEEVKVKLQQAVVWPLLHTEAFARLGLPRPKGVLLYGPPGCCKTTLVRAVAGACHATFLAVSGAQVYSPFLGESEKTISQVFQRARATAPAIIFLDEIDSLVGKRGEGAQSGVQERVLSTLLNEMDGIGVEISRSGGSLKVAEGSSCTDEVEKKAVPVTNNNVLVVAATNRPDMLDSALLRPGRVDRTIYVPPPDLTARAEILRVHSCKMPLSQDVDIQELADRTSLYSGADLENLCREAAMQALQQEGLDTGEVRHVHFMAALQDTAPSLDEEELQQYQTLFSK
ncbi:SPATA5L1 [Branchiostoma lanceolatum]|uniref:SPATA5L1 protein n=1 Tax=Branchiostoma lanceolatum TaxID=7740 RepID=A0A8K0EIX7_BRALA|nr:SPATA5L1 [Branchiostoma lanceolatum]